MKNKPLYNSRIINTFIKLIKKKYNYINISKLLNYAGMEPYQVADEGHWFTQKQVDLFYKRLEKLTGNKNIAREAGKYTASPDAIGVMRRFLLGFIGPANTYEVIGRYANKFTRSSVYESKRIALNKIEITVTPKKGVQEKAYQCENRLGFWDAISLLFNYSLPKIEHPECIFRGDKCCRYIVSWRESHSVLWKTIRNYAILVLSAISAGVYLIYSDVAAYTLLASIFIVLGLIFYDKILENRELNNAIISLKDLSKEFVEQIDSNYSDALMLNEIGQTLNSHISMDKILSEVMKILEKSFGYDRGMILLSNDDKTRLNFYRGFGYTDEQFNLLQNINFHLDKSNSKGVFVVSFREKKPILINNINEIEATLSPRSFEFMKRMNAKSFICCPITYETQSLGILAADNIETKRPLRQSDVNILMGITSHIGISINNARISEAKDRQFQSILKTLAASIDARDFLTAGHSERVAEYSVGICNETGMSKEYTEMIRVASLLHDYGKIGVSDNVLKKNGPLTKEEYEEIKTHAEKTRNILEQFNFEGIYKEVSIVAGSHHEKLDGSGYPKGLRDSEIPLGAKIIGVADFFEALTSRRHYRAAMQSSKAFDLLNKGKTLGVFQLESQGIQGLAKQLHIDIFEEIIAVEALYRPGPMDMIPSFISRKHGREKIEIDHPLMKDILKETYGVMVYQEQVMQIASTLAGFSLGEGDVLRRAMGKKDLKEMASQRQKFVEGAKKNGIDERVSENIFNKIEKFASYGFNKSHATAYAFISYVTAYFKANYTKEWLAALMTCDRYDLSKVAKFIRECKSLNIAILPPSVNEAEDEFISTKDGIRFAMSAIKGIGSNVVEAIVEERNNSGTYKNLFDFIKRVDKSRVGKKNIELLIDSGGFDFSTWTRPEMKISVEKMYDQATKEQEDKAKGEIGRASCRERV